MIYHFSTENTGGGGRGGEPSGEKKINIARLIEGLGGRGIRYLNGRKDGLKDADDWSIRDFRRTTKITSPAHRKGRVDGYKNRKTQISGFEK